MSLRSPEYMNSIQLHPLAISKRADNSKAASQACELYDLPSGKQIGRFATPFPTELVDLSPDGKLGLFRIDREKDRLDIWDLASGKHILGFRPFK